MSDYEVVGCPNCQDKDVILQEHFLSGSLHWYLKTDLRGEILYCAIFYCPYCGFDLMNQRSIKVIIDKLPDSREVISFKNTKTGELEDVVGVLALLAKDNAKVRFLGAGSSQLKETGYYIESSNMAERRHKTREEMK